MSDNVAMVSDEISSEETEENEVVAVFKKSTKKGKWTYESAIGWLSKNGHKVGEKQVHLSDKAGIASFGCADYLKNYHKFEVFYAGKEK
jgi:hypothetical protein